MTRKEIRDDLLLSVGIEDVANAPSHALESAARAVNRALQDLRIDPTHRFAGRTQVEVSFSPLDTTQRLPDTLQTVEVVRRNGAPSLRQTRTLSDVQNYAQRFAGATTEAPGVPSAYFVEIRHQDQEDAVEMYLHISPAPIAQTAILVEGTKKAPSYTVADMADAVQKIPVAHKYVESLLLPLARHHMAQSPWQTNERLAAALMADAKAASAAAGLTLPWPDVRKAEQPQDS